MSQEHVGYAFVSAAKSEVAMVRRNGFLLSKLPPYDRWEPFRDEARRLWNRYVEVVQPLRVFRIGVRYINRLEIPLPVGELRDYVKTLPEISPVISQRLSGYVMHLELPQPDIENGIVILNEAIVDAASPDLLALVLDIDVAQGTDLSATSGQVWDVMEQLRVRERTIFEASITDRTRELFE